MSLIGNMASAHPFLTSRTLPKSGPFPPPGLAGFPGTMSLSDFPHGPACPSRASGLVGPPDHPGGSPVLRCGPLPACQRPYSGRTRDLCRSVVPWRRPSPSGRRVGSCEVRFRSLLSVHDHGVHTAFVAFVLARQFAESPLATHFRPRLTMVSLPPPPPGLLPAGTTSYRVGFAPTEPQHLFTAHVPEGRLKPAKSFSRPSGTPDRRDRSPSQD